MAAPRGGAPVTRGKIRVSGWTKWLEVSSEIARLLPSKAAWKCAARALEEMPQGDDLAFLVRLAVLAAQYGEPDLALSWIDARQRGAAPHLEEGLGACEVARMAVDLASKDYGAVEDRLRSMDWRKVPSAPWIVNTRLLLALRWNDAPLFLDLLRRPSSELPHPPDFDEPYDRGNRLRILGLHFFAAGRWRRGLGCFRAALRELAKDRAVDARLKEVEILGACGTAAYHGGHLEEAQDYLESAIEAAGALHHSFYRGKFEHELALVHADREEYGRAEMILLKVEEEARERDAGTASDHFLRTGALISAGCVAIETGEGAKAAQYLDAAGTLLGERDHPRYRGYLHLSMGRLASLSQSAESSRKAFEEYDRAEACFRSLGDGDLIGLAKVRLHRGRLHLKLREVREALAEAFECAKAARESHFQPVEASCLLFKSQLLLEKGIQESEGLYEEVLGHLGSVRSPRTLFKVISNLYLYSWELGERLDLTAYHLRQINRMAEILDRRTFDTLYETHVVQRVARRLVARTFGLDPAALGPEES